MKPSMRARFLHLITIEALLTVAGSMAGVFSVVYLVSINLTVLEASLFYLEAFGVAVILCFLARSTGFRRPRLWMVAGMLSLSLFYLCFAFLDGRMLLFIAPVFFGPYIVGFWVPFNVLMLRLTTRKNRGQLIGLFFLVFPVINLVSPVTGGFIISRLGYDWLFIAAFVALLANAILILRSPFTMAKAQRPRFSFGRMGKRLSLALFFEGGQEGVWLTATPLLALVFVRDEMMLGILFSLFGLAGGIASVIIGRISDRTGSRAKFVRLGALLSAPLILGAAFAPDMGVYVIMVCALSMVTPIIPILLFALASDRMERREATLSLTRELLLNSGRVLGGVLFVMAILFTNDVRLAYAVMAFMVLGVAVVK